MQKAALLSVSDKSGLISFAKGLVELGYTLLSTSGTLKALLEAQVPVESIEKYTGQEEILDGRVKTLHPRIHGGILAKHDDENHIQQLISNNIAPIEIVVVNLYPFIQTLEDAMRTAGDTSLPKMVEKIDIGGPTMIRAAAKNHRSVIPVIDPGDYQSILEQLRSPEGVSSHFRHLLAKKVFTTMAAYDLAIASYFGSFPEHGEESGPPIHPPEKAISQTEGFVGQRELVLRYGENPHQKGGFYRAVSGHADLPWRKLHGKDLSYNNLLDVDAAISILGTFCSDGFRETDSQASHDEGAGNGANLPEPTVAILKHLNPCGVASATTVLEAVRRAKACDPRSHFGGIVCFNREVSLVDAEVVHEDFAEIVVAPSFSHDALELLSRKKALRLIEVNPNWLQRIELRSAAGGILVQQPDVAPLCVPVEAVVTTSIASQKQLDDLLFAWRVCRHVKSNAIVIARDKMTIGIGAGQMSRIDSVEVALMKGDRHGHSFVGAVAASDAFFPFPDGVQALVERGVTAIVAPKGARRDDEVIDLCNRFGVALYLVEDRHFRH